MIKKSIQRKIVDHIRLHLIEEKLAYPVAVSIDDISFHNRYETHPNRSMPFMIVQERYPEVRARYKGIGRSLDPIAEGEIILEVRPDAEGGLKITSHEIRTSRTGGSWDG